MTAKLSKWFMFSVVMALLPVLFNFFFLLATARAPTLTGLTGNGELLLIAAALSSVAIGELIDSKTEKRVWKIIAGGSSVVVLATASLFFAMVATMNDGDGAYDSGIVALASLTIYIVSVTCSGASMMIAEDVG